MLINVEAKEFKQQFESDTHPFISNRFIELNKGKVDRIVRLVEDKPKFSIGLIAGIKNKILTSPFSAPFGGFHYRNESIYINEIENFLDQLIEYAKFQDIEEIFLIFPPAIYQQSFNAKTVNALIRMGFEMELPEITNWVELKHFKERFSHKNSREYYQQAVRNQLSFRILDRNEEKYRAYELIKENRTRHGRPIFMTYDEIIRTNELWPIDFFSVINTKGEILASGIFYQFHQNIVYAAFWGDNDFGRPLRAMDFLVYNSWSYYKSLGYEFIDLGISTEKGMPNEGLLRFKETHECSSSLRYSFYWKNK